MTREQAKRLLGLIGDEQPSNDAIIAAYRSAARASHPDSAGEATSGVTLRELQAARRVLWHDDTEVVNDDTDMACKLCRGSGMVRGRIGASRCVACEGTGEPK